MREGRARARVGGDAVCGAITIAAVSFACLLARAAHRTQRERRAAAGAAAPDGFDSYGPAPAARSSVAVRAAALPVLVPSRTPAGAELSGEVGGGRGGGGGGAGRGGREGRGE